MFLGDSLIFIISQPRSGSTLLQRMLSVHPQIGTAAETWLMLHPIYGLREKGIWTDYNHQAARMAVRDFLNLHCGGEHIYYEAVRAFAQLVYERALSKSNKTIFIDKAPPYTMIVSELPIIFPNAKFIFLLRNPIAVLSSCIETWIKGNWGNLWWLHYDLLKAPINILIGIGKLKEQCHVIHYEDLVTHPSKNLHKICEFIGIDYVDKMHLYGNRPPPIGMSDVKLPNQLTQMGDQKGIHLYQEPVENNIDKWKQLKACAQRNHFALSYLNNLGCKTFEKFGYSYSEVEAELKSAHSNVPNPIIPWEIAIKPPEERFRSEVLKLQWKISLQKKGFLRGFPHFIRNIKILIKAVPINSNYKRQIATRPEYNRQ